MKHRLGILLSGCGALDGTDPHEAVLVMLAAEEAGFEVVPLAMGGPQMHVVDHTTAQEAAGQARQMLQESSRLVRGKIHLVEEIAPKLLEALVIPGGQGPVKSFFSDLSTASGRVVVPDLAEFIRNVHLAGGIVAAISLAEFIVSDVLGPWPEGKGCFDIPPEGVLVDEEGRKILAPGYTAVASLPQLYAGMKNLAAAIHKLLPE